MKKRIFITGATGFIGAKLTLKLADNGHEVHLLCRSREKASMFTKKNIKIFEGDILDKAKISEAMKSCDYVYHIAGHASVWASSPEIFYNTNVQGTVNILDIAFQQNVKKVVVTSTASVLGPSHDSPVNENSIRRIDFFHDYEASKYIMEERVQHYALKGLDVVIVNPTRVYGPGLISESNAVSWLVNRYMNGKWRFIPGDGHKTGNYVYIDDVVNGHILAMEQGVSGEKYILGGSNVSFNTFFSTLKNVSGKNYRLFKIPKTLMMTYAWISTLWARILKRPPRLTPKWCKKYMYDWAVSSDKASKELGYKKTPLNMGLKQTVQWLRNVENNKKPYTLITGASAGIGKSMAIKCAQLKMNLALVALPNTGLGKLSKRLSQKYGIKVHYFPIDLTGPEATTQVHQWCLKNNLKVNILINNAGIGHLGAFDKSNIDYNEKMMLLNMVALVNITRRFLPELKQHDQAHILNVGSITSLFPIPYKSVYSASKSFVLSFSKSLREELRRTPVKVTCLCPGGTITNADVKARINACGKLYGMFSMSSDKLVSLTFNKFLNGQAVIIPGWYNRFFISLSRVIPKSLIHLYLGKILIRAEF